MAEPIMVDSVSNPNNKVIFVIDPNLIVGLDIQKQLSKKGYEVHHLANLNRSVEKFVERIPDLIIADASIQKEPVFEKMKPYFEKGSTPLICVSTSDVLKTLKACPTINIIRVFEKPFNSEELISFIDQRINN